jgi:hypothetical protein
MQMAWLFPKVLYLVMMQTHLLAISVHITLLDLINKFNEMYHKKTHNNLHVACIQILLSNETSLSCQSLCFYIIIKFGIGQIDLM